MCGRFTKKYTWAEIHRMYSLLHPAAILNFQPSYNVCPTDPVDMVVAGENGREQVSNVRWALVPYWWNKTLKESMKLASFNARVETVTTKPFFREPFKKKRCLMPASGYFEWQDTPGDKQPWYFTPRDDSPLLTVAGLWDEWKNRETGERIKSCAMQNVEQIDVMEVALKMSESLADVILTAAKEDQANLLAHSMAHLGAMFVEKETAGEGDTTH